ncbi:Cobyrinic acid A,C-diamide synthase [Pseudovibrio axinellae]|uniref:Hydrogenobyrinate a,c-diamide synthase n=1 Tax=Pseudovibrio axinellae TaxID=989403 RepID=A0A165YVC7_9HYPH|nr:cobyrinate a,c-diamide synthase [Pseudovibrio axinellae]KZL19267.1 Cobyrinic acid A,C-diamide synthase [Pseudovibrio axinellae]SEQ43553.1 cobyrinic acid a,c-diamide synthase [Pseudovibrio axinellae]
MSIAKGFVIAAPSSGSGKTTITLALLRALRETGLRVASGKSGPDYIDPAFHKAASGRPCLNYDAWAMSLAQLSLNATEQAEHTDVVVIEGAMGLFDGAADGSGSVADLATHLGLPIILVVDCKSQAHSVAALVHGFLTYQPHCHIAGVILNRVGSPRHERILRQALEKLNVIVLGAFYRSETLALPERHLGLVQASEREDLEAFLIAAGAAAAKNIDMLVLMRLAKVLAIPARENKKLTGISHLPPLGQHMAIAKDIAFAFNYEHLLNNWQKQGATLSFFSPLADESPSSDADAIFLCGGYPELHAETLAHADNFKSGMIAATQADKLIYGECGGYMALGQTLTDKAGQTHEMLGLLPHDTSFAKRKLHLGYRKLRCTEAAKNAGFPWQKPLGAHEFHYSTLHCASKAPSLFEAQDAEHHDLDPLGHINGRIMGSFAHVVAERSEDWWSASF